MPYIFIDESGDLGFNFKKKNTSKYFIITFLAVDIKRPFEKIVSKIHKNLRKKYKIRSGVLHATHEEVSTRNRLCKALSEKDCNIMVIYLEKEKILKKLNNEKDILYNMITKTLLDRILNKKLVNINETIQIIASRREISKFLNENFKKYLLEQIKKKHNISISVQVKTPAEEKILQLADVVSWSIFRKYEFDDNTYYKMIKNRIVEESCLYE